MAVRPVSPFGAQLRKAREAKGLSLAHIAAVTKISVRALEAVERSDYSRLPGGIFMRSFVRAYAGEVGLDPDAALKSFLAECPDDIASVPTGSPESIDGPTTERWYHRIPWTRLAVLALLAAAIVGSAVYLYGRHSAPDQVHQTPTVPSEPPAQAPAAVAQPSPAPSDTGRSCTEATIGSGDGRRATSGAGAAPNRDVTDVAWRQLDAGLDGVGSVLGRGDRGRPAARCSTVHARRAPARSRGQSSRSSKWATPRRCS